MSDKDYWRLKLGIEIGMSKRQALEKFLEWQEGKRTCQRCEGEEYFDYCPVRLICKEAMTLQEEVIPDESGREVDTRSRTTEEFRLEEAGIG